MQYYFAPMEGLTDHIYRKLHHRYFPGIDKYFTPFLSPTVHRKLTPKESKELPPADSLGYIAVPQLLTKNAEDFLWMASQCDALGYQQIDLNLGCPSGTVTAKGKGSGMLTDPDLLDRFLDEIYTGARIKVSVKTRLGFHSAEEFPRLLEIFNRYPIYELTVHPRIRDDFYKGPVNAESFALAANRSSIPVCYNGNFTALSQTQSLLAQFPSVNAIMIGRGLIGDPGMLTAGGTTVASIKGLYDELLAQYTEAFGGPRNAMFRLKEHWRYLSCRFDGSEKLYKRLRKTTSIQEYRSITEDIFSSCPLLPELNADW